MDYLTLQHSGVMRIVPEFDWQISHFLREMNVLQYLCEIVSTQEWSCQ